MSTLDFKSIFAGYDELHATLDELSERITNRVFRRAGRVAAKAVAQRAQSLTPQRKTEGADGLGHLRARFKFVQRVYPSSNKMVYVIGSESGAKNRINHLVEFGTDARFTNSRSRYKTIQAGAVMRTRRVKTAAGWKTVKEITTKKRRISTGSLRRNNGKPSAYRGVMPAFHQLQRAWNETPVSTIVTEEIRASLTKIADKNASAD